MMKRHQGLVMFLQDLEIALRKEYLTIDYKKKKGQNIREGFGRSHLIFLFQTPQAIVST
jgi:hypothetical protein